MGITDLAVKVGADIGSFKSGMSMVNKDIEATGGGFAKFGGLVMGAGLAGLAAVTGIAAFGAAAVAKTEAAGQAAYEMSEKFGLLPGVASAWMAVGSQIGLSNDQIGTGFKFVSKTSEAMSLTIQSGGKISKATAEPYKLLGINVLDAGGKVKNANELMLEAADGFQRMKDGPEKTALAMKLFGKSGADLIPMLNEGRAGIEKMIASGKSMGDVMSGPEVAAAHKLFLEHKQLDTALSGVTTRIGAFLMPVMITLMGFVLGTFVPGVQRLAAYFTAHLWPAIQQVGIAFLTLLGPALKYISDHFDLLKVVGIVVVVDLVIFYGVVFIVLGLLVLAWVGLFAGIAWLVSHFRSGFPAALGHVQDFVIGGLKSFLSFKAWLTNLPGDLAKGALGVALAIVTGIFAGLVALQAMLMGAITNLIPGGASGPVKLALHAAGVPGFALGGIVPGPYVGAPALIEAHAGETVTRPGQQLANVAAAAEPRSSVVRLPPVITMTGVPDELAARIRAMIDRHSREFLSQPKIA